MSRSCQCPPQVPRPIWPSNSVTEQLYGMQILFNRDTHNHDEVLGERYYNLPFLIPENEKKPKAVYVNGYTGRVEVVPYSTDNQIHQDWVPFRLSTNVNTPIGSDANIFFEGVPSAEIYSGYKDWLDQQISEPEHSETIDQRVANTCNISLNSKNPGPNEVCTMTCIDWWTNRPVPQQGALTRQGGAAEGAGCPWGTVQAMSCYSCSTHNTYVKGGVKQ